MTWSRLRLGVDRVIGQMNKQDTIKLPLQGTQHGQRYRSINVRQVSGYRRLNLACMGCDCELLRFVVYVQRSKDTLQLSELLENQSRSSLRFFYVILFGYSRMLCLRDGAPG